MDERTLLRVSSWMRDDSINLFYLRISYWINFRRRGMEVDRLDQLTLQESPCSRATRAPYIQVNTPQSSLFSCLDTFSTSVLCSTSLYSSSALRQIFFSEGSRICCQISFLMNVLRWLGTKFSPEQRESRCQMLNLTQLRVSPLALRLVWVTMAPNAKWLLSLFRGNNRIGQVQKIDEIEEHARPNELNSSYLISLLVFTLLESIILSKPATVRILIFLFPSDGQSLQLLSKCLKKKSTAEDSIQHPSSRDMYKLQLRHSLNLINQSLNGMFSS